MRRLLDAVYNACGFLACVFLAGIAVLILLQIAGRLGGVLIPSADDLAGYSMGASSFLALAYALRKGGHIRVTLFLGRFGPRARRWAEIWCLSVSLALIVYAAYWCIFLTVESYDFGDVSPGLLAIPLWMPQIAMSLGISLLAVALLDELVQVIRGRQATYETGSSTLLEADRLGDAIAPRPPAR